MRRPVIALLPLVTACVVPMYARAPSGTSPSSSGVPIPRASAGGPELLAAIEQTACRGACPVYRASVWTDGHLELEGIENVRQLGVVEAHLGLEALGAIEAAITRAEVETLASLYATAVISDLPTTITWVRSLGRTREVRRDHADRTAPARLLQLERELLELMGVSAWLADVPAVAFGGPAVETTIFLINCGWHPGWGPHIHDHHGHAHRARPPQGWRRGPRGRDDRGHAHDHDRGGERGGEGHGRGDDDREHDHDRGGDRDRDHGGARGGEGHTPGDGGRARASAPSRGDDGRARALATESPVAVPPRSLIPTGPRGAAPRAAPPSSPSPPSRGDDGRARALATESPRPRIATPVLPRVDRIPPTSAPRRPMAARTSPPAAGPSPWKPAKSPVAARADTPAPSASPSPSPKSIASEAKKGVEVRSIPKKEVRR